MSPREMAHSIIELRAGHTRAASVRRWAAGEVATAAEIVWMTVTLVNAAGRQMHKGSAERRRRVAAIYKRVRGDD